MSDRPKTIHDEAKIRDALKRLIDGVWCGGDRSSRVEVHRSIAPCFSIPANYDRDADLILGVAIDELMRLRKHFDSCEDCHECAVECGAIEPPAPRAPCNCESVTESHHGDCASNEPIRE